jgi:hypothetical protein
MMNWNEFKGSGSGLILRYSSGIRMQGVRKTRKNLSWYIRSLGRDLNTKPSEYEAGVTSVFQNQKTNRILKPFCKAKFTTYFDI